MRIVKQSQSRLGQVDIAKIAFDARSRDDIPALLKGLQFIYVNEALRTQIFTLLEDSLNSSARKDTGRPPRHGTVASVCIGDVEAGIEL